MTKNRSTKRALLTSTLALLLCVSMLVGSTFAWFTDSVTSSGNKIQAGTLDVQLLMYNGTEYADISENEEPIFGAAGLAQNSTNTLWEPGKTQVAYLAIKNAGNLALKYTVGLDVKNVSKDLYEVMQYAITPDATNENPIGAWNAANGKCVNVGMQTVTSGDTIMDPDATHYFALSIHMDEQAGNEYQGGEVDFDLTVLATQATVESDSFGNEYDKDSLYPLGKGATVGTDFNGYKVTIEIPTDAPAYDYGKPIIENVVYNNDKSNATLKFDMSLADADGNKQNSIGATCPVTIKLPHPFVNMDNFKVLHNHEEIEGATYDPATNTVSFKTDGFSPFEIQYVDYVDPSFEMDFTEVNGNYTIKKAMFVGKNPVEYDASLAAADSKYIAVDYTKNGTKHYVVSERATSVFVAPDATTQYIGENGTFDVNNVDFRRSQSGKLWSLISGLQANEHNTLYLLPGTYTEATTINVYSSMDIIGLGDTDTVRVVKPSSSKSNRHLFNCNGQKAEYIEVTLRNMCLDATIRNDAGQDNAAVQSIRKSKVKCYGLNIVKATGFGNYPFYVNGNNAVDGVKYTAYLYVADCTTNATSAITASGSYKFYHNNLIYGGGKLYTSNSGNNKKTTMAANDWWN